MLNAAVPTTIQMQLVQATRRLTHADSARLDAEILLAYVLQKPRSYLYAWPDNCLNVAQLAGFERLLARRQAGEPIAYLVGQQSFWSLELQVSPATLIPRPETELLVEQVLHLMPAEQPITVLDLGTGSGAIALSIAKERPNWQVVATDISATALAIAGRNAQQAAITNVTLQVSDWFSELDNTAFDVIVSNPPYIAENDAHLQQGDVQFEPRQALVAGGDGLDAIRVIVNNVQSHLRKAGWLLLEHGYTQADAVQWLLKAQGFQQVNTINDLAGLARVSGGQLR